MDVVIVPLLYAVLLQRKSKFVSHNFSYRVCYEQLISCINTDKKLSVVESLMLNGCAKSGWILRFCELWPLYPGRRLCLNLNFLMSELIIIPVNDLVEFDLY